MLALPPSVAVNFRFTSALRFSVDSRTLYNKYFNIYLYNIFIPYSRVFFPYQTIEAIEIVPLHGSNRRRACYVRFFSKMLASQLTNSLRRKGSVRNVNTSVIGVVSAVRRHLCGVSLWMPGACESQTLYYFLSAALGKAMLYSLALTTLNSACFLLKNYLQFHYKALKWHPQRVTPSA